MKIFKIGLIVVVVSLVLVIGVAGYLINSLLSGAQKDRITALASQALGTAVTLDSYSVDFGSLLVLQPAVIVHGLKVANPEGFPQRNILEAGQVSLSVDLKSALGRKIEVKSLIVEQPRILIEAPAGGPTNLEALLNNLKKSETAQPVSAGAPSDPGSNEISGSVSSVMIRDAVVSIAAPPEPQPRETLKSLNLTISEIRAGSPSKFDLSTKVFDSANTNLHAGGVVGPLGGAGLPVDGKVESQVALAEFPDPVRKRYLGELASAPGPDSRVNVTLGMKGDLYGTMNGAGKVDFAKFLIGANAQNRLDLSGGAPLVIRTERAISGGDIEVQSKAVTLKLGSGQWAGDLDVSRRGTTLSGAISGAIRSVDVNQMLTSFAASPDVIYGTLTIPQFRLAFQGASSAALQKSLNGSGSLRVDNGRFKGLRVLAGIERALGGAPSDTGEFAKFETNFTIQNQAVALKGIEVTGPGISSKGEGVVGFNEALNFRLESKLQGNAANLLKARTGGFANDLAIPVQITGTVANPQVRPELGNLTKGAVKGAVKGVLDKFLKRPKKE